MKKVKFINWRLFYLANQLILFSNPKRFFRPWVETPHSTKPLMLVYMLIKKHYTLHLSTACLYVLNKFHLGYVWFPENLRENARERKYKGKVEGKKK